MTGEMYSITKQGVDSNGDCWAMHAAVARAVGGRLEPFDVYQGPYIVVGPDVRVGSAPYQLAVQHLGVKRLWIVPEDDSNGAFVQVYREDTDTLSELIWWEDTGHAAKEARKLLKEM